MDRGGNQIIHFLDEFLLLGSSKGRGSVMIKGHFHPKYLSTCCGSGTFNMSTEMGSFQLQLFICRVFNAKLHFYNANLFTLIKQAAK